MTERPILFSDPMVRAILAGTKTQTRRIATSGQWGSASREYAAHADFDRAWVDGVADNNQYLHVPCHVDAAGLCEFCDRWGLAETTHRLWPRYQLGDLLWVRETWANIALKGYPPVYFYRADCEDLPPVDARAADNRWRPSIHMPRAASRITLRVTSVRVERLQETSEDDARAEGVRYTDFGEYSPPGAASLDGGRTYHPFKPRHRAGYHVGDVTGPEQCHHAARLAFGALWDSINGKRAPWSSNPWVWAITFEQERVRR